MNIDEILKKVQEKKEAATRPDRNVRATNRQYGKFGWITIDDIEYEGQEPSTRSAKEQSGNSADKHETRPDMDQGGDTGGKTQSENSSFGEGSASQRWRAEKAAADAEKARKGGYAGFSWYTILRMKWRDVNRQARRRGFDGLPWDAYNALWNAAGDVEEEGTGEMIPAWKQTGKYWDRKRKSMLMRKDTKGGWRPGNVIVVDVKGPLSGSNDEQIPDRMQVLATWDEDGWVRDRDGQDWMECAL